MTRLKCIRPRLAPAPVNGWKPDEIRGTRQQRGYGAEWDRLRLQILDRDDHLCQPCLRVYRVTVATQVDHITPKARGGTDEPANLQAICDACHRSKTSSESQGGGET